MRITNLFTVTGDPPKPVYYVAGLNTDTGSRILKAAVYDAGADVPMTVTFAGVSEGTAATLTVLSAPSDDSSNELGVAPVVMTDTETLRAGAGGTFTYTLPNMSVSLLEVKDSA